MRKFRIVIICLLLLSFLALAGCNKKIDNTIDEASEGVSTSPVQASMAHGTPTGLWFMLASGVAESVNNTYPGSLLELSPGNNSTNFFLANEHSIDFGLVLSNNVYEGYNGIGQYDRKYDQIGGVSIFYQSTFQLLLREDIDIASFEEIIENKISIKMSIGAPRGTAQAVFDYVLKEYDLTKDDMIEWGCRFYEKDLTEAGELFKDGAIDAIWYIAGAPTPVFMQLGTNEDLVLLELPEHIINILVEQYGFGHYTLLGGTYSFMPDDYKSLCSYSMMVASNEVAEDIVYKVTKSINENLDYIGKIHSALTGIDSDRLITGMPIPLHPGAEKYYREIGLID